MFFVGGGEVVSGRGGNEVNVVVATDQAFMIVAIIVICIKIAGVAAVTIPAVALTLPLAAAVTVAKVAQYKISEFVDNVHRTIDNKRQSFKVRR